MSTAYLLVNHGSRDPRPEIAMQKLASLLSEKLPNSNDLVSVASLEMGQGPLHTQIVQLALGSGCNHLKIIPLFLLPGVHTMRDIPAEVVLAQQILPQDLMIELRPYLGSHPGLGKLLALSLVNLKVEARILLAHGSRSADGNALATMAASLGAVVAFWSVPPSLESQVRELVAAGCREILILLYFLFPGGISDAIATSIEKLTLEFPGVIIQLTQPLGASAELVELIWDLIQA